MSGALDNESKAGRRSENEKASSSLLPESRKRREIAWRRKRRGRVKEVLIRARKSRNGVRFEIYLRPKVEKKRVRNLYKHMKELRKTF